MIRVTLKDPQQTISFLTGEDIARRLVAACGANPGTAGDLLLAAEIFHQGIAAAVMVELMAFDKALLRHGTAQAAADPQTGEEANKLVRDAFQVVDEDTRARAFTATQHPLLVFDLPQRTIQAPAQLDIQPSGELLAHSGNQLTGRAITYVLPKQWTLATIPP